jgi:hypothetical protein
MWDLTTRTGDGGLVQTHVLQAQVLGRGVVGPVGTAERHGCRPLTYLTGYLTACARAGGEPRRPVGERQVRRPRQRRRVDRGQQPGQRPDQPLDPGPVHPVLTAFRPTGASDSDRARRGAADASGAAPPTGQPLGGRAHRLVRLATTGRRLAALSSVDAQDQGASLLRRAMHPPGPPLADRTRLCARPPTHLRQDGALSRPGTFAPGTEPVTSAVEDGGQRDVQLAAVVLRHLATRRGPVHHATDVTDLRGDVASV